MENAETDLKPAPPAGTATASIRRAGWAAGLLGLFLILGVGAAIAKWHPDSHYFVVMAAIVLFGLSALFSGYRMISTGRRNRLNMFLILGALFLMFGSGMNLAFEGSANAPVESRGKADLVKIADKLSQKLPKMVDPETRWESVSAGPGDKLTYRYTLVNYTAADVNRNAIASFLSGAKKPTCASPLIKEALTGGSTMEFKWQGKDGGQIAELRLTEGECR